MRGRFVPAAVLTGALLLVGACSTTVSGNPELGVTVLPGGPTVTTVPPGTTPAEEPSATPGATSSAPASTTDAGPIPIADNGNGYTFLQTASGRARCRVSETGAGCQLTFDRPGPRTESGDAANGVNVGSDGVLTYVLGDIGVANPVTLQYRTYTARGWTIVAAADGTRFTHQGTGHGMVVSTAGARAF